MASGHEYRANRPNTWLLRPMLQSEGSSCQPGAVHTWALSGHAEAIWGWSPHGTIEGDSRITQLPATRAEDRPSRTI